MDPNAALKRIRELIKDPLSSESELCWLVDGLDHWLSTGGDLPEAWKRK